MVLELTDEVKATLKPGKNVIAAHCHNTTGGAYLDFGLSKKQPNSTFFDRVAKQTSVPVKPTQT